MQKLDMQEVAMGEGCAGNGLFARLRCLGSGISSILERALQPCEIHPSRLALYEFLLVIWLFFMAAELM
ncbi:hypothetical protein [Pseudomonas schmalbachii]|uniref:Uncharacterized protein n=1 Tax=Pseudomonas schmalbachii TaxID=2816993 RepID=A0ABS3TNK1_9PSED|nr:hypothetical protein [Pseudomonas schmalbachii]MBO3274738.1 hypothetical protein [Pseudomonas schmalbachii]